MISIDFSDWHRYNKLLEERMQRCQTLPPQITTKVFETVKEFLTTEVFIGKHSQAEQLSNWEQTRRGYYGQYGTEDPYIINPLENLGGHSEIPGKSGPGFLESLSSNVVEESGSVVVEIHTGAKMTPYDKTAGGTKPVMVYFRAGWIGDENMMKPRIGSPGHEIAKGMVEKGYAERLAAPILHWIFRGAA